MAVNLVFLWLVPSFLEPEDAGTVMSTCIHTCDYIVPAIPPEPYFNKLSLFLRKIPVTG